MKTHAIYIAAILTATSATTLATVVVDTQKSATPLSFSTDDLAQTDFLSSSATGGNELATEHAQLFNGQIGNADGDTNESGEVTLGSGNSVTINFTNSTSGYNLTGIDTLFGWNTGANGRSNQAYSVVLTYTDNSTATLIGPQVYEPNSPAAYWTKVSMTDSLGGVLTNGAVAARGVKSVTFQDFSNANAGGVVVAREFDIFGEVNQLVLGEAQVNGGNVAPSPITAVSGDLLETAVASVTGENGSALVRNGVTGTAGQNSGAAPASIWGQGTTDYVFDTTGNAGYNITWINIFSGWTDSRAGQSYEIWYSQWGSADFILLGSVQELVANGSLLTRTYNADGSAFLTNVDVLRFVQVNSGNAGVGTVFREFDVFGYSVPTPAALPVGLAMLGLAACRQRGRTAVRRRP